LRLATHGNKKPRGEHHRASRISAESLAPFGFLDLSPFGYLERHPAVRKIGSA
jgi:hypothetical protein